MTDAPRDLAISVSGLRKTFVVGFFRKHIEAVKDSTFDVRRGEIYGLVGPNGAGKSTTIKMLLGLIHPDGGDGTILGEPMRSTRARRHVGFLPETPHFYDYLKPTEFLDYFGQLYGVDAADRKRRIPELLDLVGLGGARDKQLRKFSKGMLQRIGIAQALLPDSELIILDEPQSGLDPIGRKDVRDIILAQRDAGKTVLFCSHILGDVEQICDRVGIVANGRVVARGPLAELVDSSIADVELVLTPADGGHARSLRELGGAVETLPNGDLRVRVDSDDLTNRLCVAAVQGGGSVRSVVRHEGHLEQVFLRYAAERDDRVGTGRDA